ncbi:ATP-dependent helicase [Cellulomonas soli]|uniref:ATP-dependent helicase n=1 Tax=Cellulomonas soli TaxID=931535 RepID=UPI003F8286FC
MSADALLDALDPDQREVALALRGPVCVLAGAGTGKTRAITHRIAYGVRTGVYRPGSVLAVTFTAKAAGEMRVRLRDLGVVGVQARTFHAAALRQLGFFWPKVVGGAPPRLVEQKAPLVADAARRLGLAVDRIGMRDLAAEIEWAKVSLVVPDEYEKAVEAIGRPVPAGYDAQAVARLLTAYEETKSERGVIDFEDVLLDLAGMLVQRGEIAEEVRAQYRHFVVDEYQDVSPLQQFLLDQWLGGRHELCVVGDPSQTIYSFAGASPYHLQTFAQQHPRATVIRLVRDYRSTPQVVGLANRLLAPTRRAGGPQPLQLIAQRPDGPDVRFTAYPDDEAEAQGVAHRVARLIAEGIAAREIAVLYRTNAQSEAFEQAFAASGIAAQVRGGERFFARRDVREAIVLLRGTARAADPDQAMTEVVRDVLRTRGWAERAPEARGAARERWDAMQALVTLADELAQARAQDGRTATVADLVAELEERAATQHAPTVDGVTLASLHAAKGLEWDAVFLIGLSEGLVPFALAGTEAELAEERRLLYVGVTRARSRLELSFAGARSPGMRAVRRRSRFLDGLWPQGDAPVARGRAGRAGQRAAAVDLQQRAVPHPGVVDGLTRWRRRTAEELGRTTTSVLSDAALTAVASRRPASLAELGEVPGIGARTLGSYGAELLDVVREATAS